MLLHNGIPSWAPKVSQAKIRRLYTSDANGIIDEELIDEVGWELWSRCDSILTVTAAHYGRLSCPACGGVIEHAPAGTGVKGELSTPWKDEEIIHCGSCNWSLAWKTYHRTYRGKQLFGANAVAFFEAYHQAFPQAYTPKDKMLLIDQLIHAFHTGLSEPGRPVGANLIEGSLKEVIVFLCGLSNGPRSAAGIGDSRDTWRDKLEDISWASLFLKPHEDSEANSPD